MRRKSSNDIISKVILSSFFYVKEEFFMGKNLKNSERYDSEIVAAIYTEPPEEFDGLVRTYLWKET